MNKQGTNWKAKKNSVHRNRLLDLYTLYNCLTSFLVEVMLYGSSYGRKSLKYKILYLKLLILAH